MPGRVSSRNRRGLVLVDVPVRPARRHSRVVVIRGAPTRLAIARQLGKGALDDRPELGERELGVHEREVLDEVEVLPVRPELVELDVGLPHQHRLRVVLGGDLLPPRVDLVHLGPVAQVLDAVAELAILDRARARRRCGARARRGRTRSEGCGRTRRERPGSTSRGRAAAARTDGGSSACGRVVRSTRCRP